MRAARRVAIFSLLVLSASRALAQGLPALPQLPRPEDPGQAGGPAGGPGAGQGNITLNFPDNVPLKVLVDYVAGRLGWNVLYDDTAVAQRVTLRVSTKLQESDLPGLLETVLRSKGQTIVDAGNGFKRIVSLAGAAGNNQQAGVAGVVTQVFRLTSAEPSAVDPVIKPMLTPGGTSVSLAESRLLVVTDTAATIARVAEMIRRIDVPSREVTIKLIPVTHAEVGALSKQLSTLLNAHLRASKGQAAPAEGAADTASGLIDVSYDARTNQILLVAPGDLAAMATAIVKQLDVPVTESQSPVRFYKLANATAVDVLATIQSLGGGAPPVKEDRSSLPSTSGVTAIPDRISSTNPPAAGPSTAYNPPVAATPEPTAPPRKSEAARALDSAPAYVREAIRGKPAQVTADPNTNTIIVIAEPAVQQLYEQLIRAMDKRRPQVLIEATIVTVDTTDNFELGVELGTNFGGNDNIFTFSSFGLSTPDATNGQLALVPGTGFNGTVINSNVANAVVRALAQSSRARVQSAPRILVNDNASGQLQSVAEQPFTSVNASNTVSTTSFAGYAEAGTQITVTPHISEADYLQLDYDVTLSSFTSQGTLQGVPPSRQRDAVNSRVTIPDGTTIVVGGLNRRNFLRTKDAVPFLGDIPVLEYLFSRNVVLNRETTLFVFIRPVILRDDQFEDLKFVSEREVKAAKIEGDFPVSEPMVLDSAREVVPSADLKEEPKVGPPRHMEGDMRHGK